MARNVLALAALTERSTISFDGHSYDLINPEELSIVDTHRVGKWGARVQDLYADLENRTEEEIAELAGLLDKLCRLLWLAPAEIHDRLTDTQRLAVATAFIGLQRGTLPVPEGASAEPEKPKDSSAVPSEMSTGASL